MSGWPVPSGRETIMKIESARQNSLKIAALCAVTFALPTAGSAATVRHQTKGNGTHACACFCYVTLGNGKTIDAPFNVSLPSQYGCGTAEGTTCNVSDPTTGGLRQGQTEACSNGSFHFTVTIKPPVTNPGGGLLQAVPTR